MPLKNKVGYYLKHLMTFMQIEDEGILMTDINEPDAVTAFIHRYHH